MLGYVRKLCTLYHVDAKRADEITCGLRALLEYEIPEDISKSVIDHEISEENERKIRQLILIMVAAVVLVVLVLVAGGVLLLAGLRGASHPGGQRNSLQRIAADRVAGDSESRYHGTEIIYSNRSCFLC